MLFILYYLNCIIEFIGGLSLKKYTIFLLIILILFIIPISFANDYVTSLDSQSVDQIMPNNIYFDSSSLDEGNGTLNSPYKFLSVDKLVDGSVVYIADGEYDLNQSKTIQNITLIGQSQNRTVINGFGNYLVSDGFLSISSLTLNNLSIKNNDKLFVNNSILKNNFNDYGGAVNVGYNASLTDIDNSSFINNHAAYAGGAVYIASNTSKAIIHNSKFFNNSANRFGGSIFIQNNISMNISHSEFLNNTALSGFGGSIFSNRSQLNVSYSVFNNSKASYGGAIYDEGSISYLSNVVAVNNVATCAGGVVYKNSGLLEVDSSYFADNSADYGAAIFGGDSSSLIVKNSYFVSNKVNFGQVIYAISNKQYEIIHDYFTCSIFGEHSFILIDTCLKSIDNYMHFEIIEVNILKEVFNFFSLDKFIPGQINDLFKLLEEISMSKSKFNMQSSCPNDDLEFNIIDYAIQLDCDGNYQFILVYGKTSLIDLNAVSFDFSVNDLNLFVKDTFNFNEFENVIYINSYSFNQSIGFSDDCELPFLLNFDIGDACANIENSLFDYSIDFIKHSISLKTSIAEFDFDFIDYSLSIICDETVSTVEIPFFANADNHFKFSIV